MNLPAASIAKHLLARCDTQAVEFYSTYRAAIHELGVLPAILGKRFLYSQKRPSRSNCLQLLMTTDLVWQLIRDLAGVTRKDRWLEHYVGGDTTPFFDPEREIVADMQWAYEQHTALRHPKDRPASWPWMLHDPWPPAEAARLVRGVASPDVV